MDVYPIDRMYKSSEKEQERKNRGKDIKRAFEIIAAEGIDSEAAIKVLADIERENHVILHRKGDLKRALILLFEQICMECTDEDYDQVALMNTWILYDWANCPRRVYEERMEIPFENNILMGTVNYDELLTTYYHDYMTIKKGGGAHEYPVYKAQEQLFREKTGNNLMRYTFRPENLHLQRSEGSFREKCFEILGLMQKSVDLCRRVNPAYGVVDDNIFGVLSGCQELAIRLGTLIEDKYGESCTTVRMIENYCEILYIATQQWSEEMADGLEQALIKIETDIREQFSLKKKEMVFIPCRSAWWDTMKPLYDAVAKKGDAEVRIMSVPYYDRDPYGDTGNCHDESDFFKLFDGFTDTASYDIRKKHPEVIVIQVPFDGDGCAMTVPPAYYSTELLKCCDELWYIPCLNPEAPLSPDDKAATAISVLIEQPAVINADRVIIDDESLRRFYVEKLTEMGGESTRAYWENKCRTIKDVVCDPG